MSTPKLPPYAKVSQKVSTVISKHVLINTPLIVQLIKEGKANVDLTHQELKELLCKTESKDAWRAYQDALAKAKSKETAEALAKAKAELAALVGQTDKENVDPPNEGQGISVKAGDKRRNAAASPPAGSSSRRSSKTGEPPKKQQKKKSKKGASKKSTEGDESRMNVDDSGSEQSL